MFKIKNGKLVLGKKEEEQNKVQEEQKPKEESVAQEPLPQKEEVVEEKQPEEEAPIETFHPEDVEQEEEPHEEVVVRPEEVFHKVIIQFTNGHLDIEFHDDEDLVVFLNELDLCLKLKSIVKVEETVINCDKIIWYKVEEWVDDGKEE